MKRLVSLMCLAAWLASGAVAAPVTKLRVMTYNVLGSAGGGRMAKTAEVIAAAQADVVGLQEATGISGTLAAMIPGFNYSLQINSGISFISKYPISNPVTAPGGRSGGVRLELSPGQFVHVFDSHFEPYPYEPYGVRDGTLTTEAQVIASALSSRGTSVNGLVSVTAAARASGLPVFLMGDYNEPSHQDWTTTAASAGLHFGMKVDWPSSKSLTDVGFRDAYRAVHPNEVTHRGDTWTPGFPAPTVAPNEVHDRIDRIYSFPNYLTTTAVQNIGFDINDGNTDLAVQPYPSDHRAVVAEFDLSTMLSGDYTLNRIVDAADYTLWRDSLGTSTVLANVTMPGSVLPADYNHWANNFGATNSVAASQAVPEPSAVVIVLVVGTILGRIGLRR